MKNLTFTITLLWLSVLTHAQNLKMEYRMESSTGTHYYKSVITDSLSIIEEIVEKFQSKNTIVVNDEGDNNDDEGVFIKNRKDGFCHLWMSAFEEKEIFYVKDTLNLMKWKLTSQTKEILGYKCKSAVTVFRGREFLAFYTEQIPISEGPWKFGGLPGLILEVQSSDGEYKFVVESITRNYKAKLEKELKQFEALKRKYQPITFQQFCNKYKEAVDRKIAYLKAKKGAAKYTIHFKVHSLEIIYPEANTGKGIAY